MQFWNISFTGEIYFSSQFQNGYIILKTDRVKTFMRNATCN